ncbi:MAG: LacI family DNA-binding transcriptional regulator [Lachnospiraceae bacterium]|nr:LacI family DNA-binding transcriptional regulator [Lachnospiraceae bacterium]
MSAERDRKAVTIKQVAEKAGVSVGTVSNLLNATMPVSEETAARIKRSVEELNYVPNMMASSLRRKTSRMIDVLVPNMSNSFYTGIISPFTDTAYSHDYQVRVFGYEYSAKREKRMLRSMENSKPGLAVVFNGIDDEEQLEALVRQGVPVILADRDTEIPSVPYIAFDNEEIFDEIIGMLKKKGYRRIGLFMEPPYLVNIRKRHASFLKALEAHGFPGGPDVVFSREDLCLDHLGNGYRYMKDVLATHAKKDLPDAWITSSDLIAIGMTRAIHEAGMRVPEDFGVVGFDNIAVSGFVQPRLTTVEQSQEALSSALWVMAEQILTGRHEPENVVLPQKLVLRESC